MDDYRFVSQIRFILCLVLSFGIQIQPAYGVLTLVAQSDAVKSAVLAAVTECKEGEGENCNAAKDLTDTFIAGEGALSEKAGEAIAAAKASQTATANGSGLRCGSGDASAAAAQGALANAQSGLATQYAAIANSWKGEGAAKISEGQEKSVRDERDRLIQEGKKLQTAAQKLVGAAGQTLGIAGPNGGIASTLASQAGQCRDLAKDLGSLKDGLAQAEKILGLIKGLIPKGGGGGEPPPGPDFDVNTVDPFNIAGADPFIPLEDQTVFFPGQNPVGSILNGDASGDGRFDPRNSVLDDLAIAALDPNLSDEESRRGFLLGGESAIDPLSPPGASTSSGIGSGSSGGGVSTGGTGASSASDEEIAGVSGASIAGGSSTGFSGGSGGGLSSFGGSGNLDLSGGSGFDLGFSGLGKSGSDDGLGGKGEFDLTNREIAQIRPDRRKKFIRATYVNPKSLFGRIHKMVGKRYRMGNI